MPQPVRAKRLSSNTLGLTAILLTVILWAVAANFAHDLFTAGVNPLELAGVSAMINATVRRLAVPDLTTTVLTHRTIVRVIAPINARLAAIETDEMALSASSLKINCAPQIIPILSR